MNANTLIEPPVASKSKLRWFTLYADFPAGIRAKQLATRVAHRVGSQWDLAIEMWKLDSVAPIGPIREMIAQEAGESDVLLIALSAVDAPDPSLDRWLHSLTGWKANRLVPGLLVGLLGDAEHRVVETHWAPAQLALFASRAQMDFVWHAAGSETWDDTDWVNASVEALLARKRNLAALTAAPGNVRANLQL